MEFVFILFIVLLLTRDTETLGTFWHLIIKPFFYFVAVACIIGVVATEPTYIFLPVVIVAAACMLYGLWLAFKWLLLLLWRYKKYLFALPFLGLFATNELVHLLALFYTSFWVMLGLVWLCYRSLRFVWVKLSV